MTTNDLWTYENSSMTAQDLTGFTVEALDGDYRQDRRGDE